MKFERARTDEQIELRIEEILSTAVEIFEKDGIDKITFFEISKKTKFTRPTIYKYFKTKEEIMLRLIIRYMENYVVFFKSFFEHDRLYSKDEVAEALTQAFLYAPKFMELYINLYTSIEKNVSVDAFTKYKTDILEHYTPLVEMLKSVTDCHSDEKITGFLNICLSLAVGFYPMCHVSELKREIIAQSGANYTVPTFSTEFKNAMVLQLDVLYA